MPLRKLKTEPKKNKGIYEYFRAADINKVTEAYYYSYTAVDGKSTRIKAISMDVVEVRRERADKIASVQLDKETSDHGVSDMILDTLIYQWADNRTKQANIKKDIAKYFNHISAMDIKGTPLGQKLVSSITIPHIVALRTELQKKDISHSTLTNILIVLKAMMNYADSIGMKSNRVFQQKDSSGKKPLLDVKKKTDNRMKLLSEEELSSLLTTAKDSHPDVLLMIQMMLYTAQRPQNILDLSISDIDLKENEIGFSEVKGQAPTYIPIAPLLKPILKERLKECDTKLFELDYTQIAKRARKIFLPFNEHLFKSKSKKMTAKEYQEAAAKAYKTNRHKWVSLYTLRHTAATMMYERTKNIKLVQTVLRHSDLKMTDRYAKTSKEQMLEGLSSISVGE